eukprot:CAMPEP_0182848012 /NCGR_PEP_ID=MMETSP0006_2-20121128/28767_1 /TAXON_ID=97485 /ORGANISM="Prymnesium parvum, Strain Texoma1" /LENGTH=80 /DNA_ID=CAMNT_0024978389 /DNA_START=286 /DNA_END=524 /DNA_ORIENTATION=+
MPTSAPQPIMDMPPYASHPSLPTNFLIEADIRPSPPLHAPRQPTQSKYMSASLLSSSSESCTSVTVGEGASSREALGGAA